MASRKQSGTLFPPNDRPRPSHSSAIELFQSVAEALASPEHEAERNPPSIVHAITEKGLFAPWFLPQETWKRWLSFLKALATLARWSRQ